MKTHWYNLNPLAPALIASIVGLCAGAACGQSSTKPYSVSHGFNLHTPGNTTPGVFLNYYEHATARTNSCKVDLKDGPGSLAIGLGATTRTITAGPVNSSATANSTANITVLAVGNVQGTITADGVARADVDGCPSPPPPRSSGSATAYSSASVSVRGRYLDSRGNIRWSGSWRNSGTVAGGVGRGIAKDPVKLKVIDNTTGITSEWTLISIRSTAGGGTTLWDNGTLANSATDGVLDISVGAPITVQQGHLRLVSERGVVTESVATGMFAGAGVPAVGASPIFSMALPEISVDFDAGADPTHDIDSEMILDGAGESEAEAAILGDDGGNSLVTDLASGPDLMMISMPQNSDTGLGFGVGLPTSHLADDFLIGPGAPQELAMVTVPLYQVGAPPGMPLAGVYVRIWANFPGPIANFVAGDMTTNRLRGITFFDTFRVPPSTPGDRTRAINKYEVDLSWVPPLPPGHYWIEIAARGQLPTEVFMPPAVWRTQADNAMTLNVQNGQWTQVQDPTSRRTVSLPIQIFGSRNEPQACYANCDNSVTAPVLNVLDFACFLNRFAAGDPWANCDGSQTPPVLNVLDFACFLNRFAAGCS